MEGEIYWARVIKPDEEGVYSLELTLTPETKKTAIGMGLQIYTSKDGAREYIKFKRNSKSKEGLEVKPPRVVDGRLQSVTKLVGNGSTGRVEFFTYKWNNPKTKRSGTSAYLVALQITNLVEYTPNARLGKFSATDESIPASETNSFTRTE